MKKKVQDLLLETRKTKNNTISNLLRTVLGEFDRIGKNPTTKECEKIVRKMSKDTTNEGERSFLESMLPQLMTYEEIRAEVLAISNENDFGDNIGKWVGEWNKRGFKGKANMKVVMDVIKYIKNK